MSDQQETRLGQQIGEYRLIHKLGGGSFGIVYLAEHIHEHTQAAVKVLDIRLSKSEDLKGFINEARTIRLRHPHIVPLLDFGISRDDLPFLVMEYAPRGTLRDRHPKGERIPLSTIVSYVEQLAQALQYAHDQRIIHRDIKPENILVRADGTLMVSDFGIAKILEQSVLLSQQKLAGTPMYMPPEQHAGYPCFASDQYALAVITYEWICGIQPFQGTAFGLAVQHLYTPPPQLRDRLPELSEAVESVILRALAKAPEDRFKRIQEFADALYEAVHSPPDTLVLNPPIEVMDTVPAIHSEPASTAMPEVRTDTEPMALKPASQTPDTPPSHQKPASVHHSSLQDTSDTVSPPPQKRRTGRKLPLLAGGTLGLILLLTIFVITIRPIIPVLQGPSPTSAHSPTHPDQIAQKWTFTTSGSVTSSPRVINGILYIGSWDHQVYALNANTGQEIWAFKTGDAVVSSPTIADGVLYVGSNDHNMYALNANTGREIWAFTTGSSVSSSPTLVNGILYFGSIDNKMYALNASTGQKIWTFLTDYPVQSSPTVADGVLYFGSWNYKVYALDANTGHEIWDFTTKGAISSSPTVANNVLYVGSYDHNVYAINIHTGQKIWAFLTGDTVYSSPTVANNVLYIGSDDHNIYAIDANTGQKIWVLTTGDHIESSPTVINGLLYVGSFDNKIYAVNANTGQTIWVFPTNDHIRSSPIVVNEVLYIGSFDHKIYALTHPTPSS